MTMTYSFSINHLNDLHNSKFDLAQINFVKRFLPLETKRIL